MAVTKFPTAELHKNIKENSKQIGALASHSAVQDERIEENRKDIDKICGVTDELQVVVIKSSFAISIGTWIVAGFGISVIALIWSLITGQASLLFK